MDVKNSPAGHVTEKCAIRQMSFSTDDNEYYELAHLFTPQNKQNPNDPVKTPEPKSSESARTSASTVASKPTAKPQPQPGTFAGSQKNPLLTTVMTIIAVIGGIAATAFAFLPQLRQMFRF